MTTKYRQTLRQPRREDELLPSPDLKKTAFFLDLDGTLLDLAATPELVYPEAGLVALLKRLEERTQGALAFVTGREISFVDALLGPHRFTVAGLHGAELRLGEMLSDTSFSQPNLARASRATSHDALKTARNFMFAEAAQYPMLYCEDKGGAIALHYRQAPELKSEVSKIMAQTQIRAGDGFRLRRGKSVIELCPAHADKGAALRTIMALPQFQGLRPMAAGDDVTDEAMFSEVNAMGGISLHIGFGEVRSQAQWRMGQPADFRSWLQELLQC